MGKSEWSAVISGTSKTRKSLLGNLNWPQKQPACSNKKEKITLPLRNIICYIQHVAGHCTDWDILTSNNCKVLYFGKI